MKVEGLSRFSRFLMFFAAPIDNGAGGNGQSQTPDGDSDKTPANLQGNEDEKGSETEKKYTDDDLNRIINEKFAKWQSQLEAKQQQAKKLAGMNDLEKAKLQQEEAEKLAAEYKAKLERFEMQNTSRNLLNEAAMPITDGIIELVTTDQADSTKSNIDALVRYGKAIREEVKREYLEGHNQIRGGKNPQTKTNLGKQLAEAHNAQASRKNPYFNN